MLWIKRQELIKKLHVVMQRKRAKKQLKLETRFEQTKPLYRRFRCGQPLIFKALWNASGCIIAHDKYTKLKPKFNIISRMPCVIPICQCDEHADGYDDACVCKHTCPIHGVKSE